MITDGIGRMYVFTCCYRQIRASFHISQSRPDLQHSSPKLGYEGEAGTPHRFIHIRLISGSIMVCVDICAFLQMDLVERVAYEAFDSALELAQADLPDLTAVDHSPAFPTLKVLEIISSGLNNFYVQKWGLTILMLTPQSQTC